MKERETEKTDEEKQIENITKHKATKENRAVKTNK